MPLPSEKEKALSILAQALRAKVPDARALSDKEVIARFKVSAQVERLSSYFAKIQPRNQSLDRHLPSAG
jgi:division protein CdvB (Snf7/Vps24/ESCRT-III family)